MSMATMYVNYLDKITGKNTVIVCKDTLEVTETSSIIHSSDRVSMDNKVIMSIHMPTVYDRVVNYADFVREVKSNA